MAFMIKNTNWPRTAGVTGGGQAVLNQRIHVQRPAAVLPQSTTEVLFFVRGGKVKIYNMVGTATVVLTATDPGLSINSTALDAAQAVVGTTLVIATTVSLASLEVDGMAQIEGDGTAIVKYTAGGILAFNGAMATTTGGWLAPQGEIYATTTGSNTTGQMKWDLWYQPLEEGAYVVAANAGTAII